MKKFLLSLAVIACGLSASAQYGTVEAPISVADALEFMNAGYEGEAVVKGIVSKVSEVNTSYGNATYFIKDSLEDEESLEVYRGYGLNGDKFTASSELLEGAIVVVSGKLQNYNGTFEFAQGNKLESYVAPEVTPDVPDAPQDVINVAEALELISQNYRGEATVKGIISEVSISLDYGNATYTIKDNLEDEEGLVVYRGYSLDGEKFTTEDEIEVGGTVVVLGTLTLYGSTPEVNTGSKILEYTAPNGENVKPEVPEAPEGVITVAEALQLLSDGYEGEATVEGIISSIQEISTSYGNATYFIKDSLEDEVSLEIYRGYYIDGEKFTSEDQIEVGGTVIVTGKLVNYNGTFEFTTGSRIVEYSAPSNSIDSIVNGNAPVEYYNLQGVRVNNPAQGALYIIRQGKKTTKAIIR
ncbi:MAG: hypothetical protein J1F67_01325 [Muribaculaceae bacterium]|nr:hypothetical protein [Muribaculaceae bacterium]